MNNLAFTSPLVSALKARALVVISAIESFDSVSVAFWVAVPDEKPEDIPLILKAILSRGISAESGRLRGKVGDVGAVVGDSRRALGTAILRGEVMNGANECRGRVLDLLKEPGRLDSAILTDHHR